jgi:hypothetical protein
MREDFSRRNVMATGVAIALAAPFSTVSVPAMPVDDAEDWPEFQRWLAEAIALEAYYERTRTWNDEDLTAIHAREDYQTEEMGRLDEIAEAMAARPIKTERQLAMLVALVVWSSDRLGGQGTSHFSLLNIADEGYRAESMNLRLLKALAPRAAQVLPEVPFTFDAEA